MLHQISSQLYPVKGLEPLVASVLLSSDNLRFAKSASREIFLQDFHLEDRRRQWRHLRGPGQVVQLHPPLRQGSRLAHLRQPSQRWAQVTSQSRILPPWKFWQTVCLRSLESTNTNTVMHRRVNGEKGEGGRVLTLSFNNYLHRLPKIPKNNWHRKNAFWFLSTEIRLARFVVVVHFLLQQRIAQIYSWLNDAIKHVYGGNKWNGSSFVIYEEGLFSEQVDSSGD